MTHQQNIFLEYLFSTYFRKLTQFADVKLKNLNWAEDVVQDTFHEAILHIETLMIHPNPGGWLMQTVKYKIKEHERTRRRYILRFLSLDTELTVELPDIKNIYLEPPGQSKVSSVEKIQKALAEEELQFLKRLIIDGASHMETSKELGITVWASQKRLERIRNKLYKIFPERKKKK